jgi:hypothetical protein
VTCSARKSGLAGYTIDACRCPVCTGAQRDYCNRRNRLLAYQQWEPYVDAEPARQHVRSLMAAGMGWMHLARITGVPNGAISRLLYGDKQRPPSRRIRPYTAAKLLAVHVDLDSLADGASVNAVGTQRRSQALAAIGWTITGQANRLGWYVNNFHKMAVKQTHVTASTARAVADLYDELSGTPAPPSAGQQRALAAAARNGWAPPAAWDDETIDDPATIPNVGGEGRDVVDEVAIRRVLDGNARYGDLKLAERRELIRLNHGRIPNLGQRIGMSGAQYKRWVAELCGAAA